MGSRGRGIHSGSGNPQTSITSEARGLAPSILMDHSALVNLCLSHKWQGMGRLPAGAFVQALSGNLGTIVQTSPAERRKTYRTPPTRASEGERMLDPPSHNTSYGNVTAEPALLGRQAVPGPEDLLGPLPRLPGLGCRGALLQLGPHQGCEPKAKYMGPSAGALGALDRSCSSGQVVLGPP